MNKKCNGCGIILQSNDEEKLGYVPIEKLSGDDTNLLCKRCFRLKHYGINKQDKLPSGLYKQEVEKAINISDLVLIVLDIIDFESSFNEEILDIVREKPTLILVNKTDLLPKNVVKNNLIAWIKNRFLEEDAIFDDLSFVSAKSVEGINGIVKKIVKYAKSRDLQKITCSVVGVSNTGKSSLLNLILSNYGKKSKLTVSKYSGTTVKNVKNTIKSQDVNIDIYDTPGLIPKGRLLDFLDIETSLKIVPKNKIIPVKYNLKKDDVLMVTKYVIIQKIDEKMDKSFNEHSVSFEISASPFVKHHKTNKEKSEILRDSDFLNMLDCEKINVEEKYINLEVNLKKNEEIAISGLGYITVSDNVKIKITYLRDLKIVIRPKMIRKKY